MKLQKIVSRLQELHPKEIDLSLDRIQDLCKRLGNPQDKIKTISIVGTNGKYSTIQAMFAVLKEANIKCNIYTSPHIKNINERFVFNNQELNDEELVSLFEEIENAKSFLRDEQSEDGHWVENIEDTAMALYGAFGDDDVTITEYEISDIEADEEEVETEEEPIRSIAIATYDAVIMLTIAMLESIKDYPNMTNAFQNESLKQSVEKLGRMVDKIVPQY